MSSIPNTPTATLADLQSLRAAMVIAIASPMLRARYRDRDVEFRSVPEGLQAIAFLDEEIARVQGQGSSRVSLAQHRRGEPALPGWPRPGGNW